MKQLLYCISLTLLSSMLICCNPKVAINNYGVAPKTSKNIGLDTFSIQQIDSMVKTDKLPVFSKWNKAYLRDAETNEVIECAVLMDSTTHVIYTVKNIESKKSKYIVQKRKYTK